jgi:hypothetical protein
LRATLRAPLARLAVVEADRDACRAWRAMLTRIARRADRRQANL